MFFYFILISDVLCLYSKMREQTLYLIYEQYPKKIIWTQKMMNYYYKNHERLYFIMIFWKRDKGRCTKFGNNDKEKLTYSTSTESSNIQRIHIIVQGWTPQYCGASPLPPYQKVINKETNRKISRNRCFFYFILIVLDTLAIFFFICINCLYNLSYETFTYPRYSCFIPTILHILHSSFSL